MLKPNNCQDTQTPKRNEKDVIKKKVTTRDIEKWEVAQLSCNFEPRSKPTDLFEKLEEKRKIRHENLLKQLANDLQELNSKTEKNIKISSEELKAHAEHFNNKLSEMLKAIDTPEVASYPSSVFIEYQKKANDYRCQQCKLVNELYEDLIKFEGERADENEKLLRVTCEEMIKIGFFLPAEVQAFVEHETLKMNQLSLSNRRCYEDLKLTLILVTEKTYKTFMDKVYCIRDKWIQFKLHETFCNLQNTAKKSITRLVPEAYTRLEMKGQELVVQLKPNNLYNTCEAKEWSKNVEEIVAVIDAYGKNLIDIYKKTINAVYEGFSSEVEELKSQLNLVDSLVIEERIIKPIVFETQNDQTREIEELEIYWQETLECVRKSVNEVTQFLLDAGKLWDRHTERICESKKLILKALEKAEKNNEAVLQDLEIKLNINLDALRQEHNPSKLEKAYEAVVAVLNSLKAKYESMYLEDVSVVEDFYKMMNLEADVLSAEIQEFIHEIHVVDCGKTVHYYPEQYLFLRFDKPLVKEIQMCGQQIQAIRNWKQGVWTAFECLSEKTRETLQPRAESWVSKKIENLMEKKSVQLELLEKRFQRVRIEIYEKRLSEIESHQEALENHKEKVNFELSKMKEDLNSLVTKELNKINFVKDYLTKLEASGMIEDRPGVIRGNQIMMERKKVELENESKMAFERFRADWETKTSDMKEENINFMKSIKLFHENGTYSAEEGKTFINVLETVDKKINSELKNIIKDSTKEENDCVKKASAIFSSSIALFNLLHEETLFNFEVRQGLQNFTSGIQDAAKALKTDLDLLKHQCYCLCMSIKNTQNRLNIDEKFWSSTIQLLYKNVSNLLFSINVPESPSPSVLSEEKGEDSEKSASRTYLCADKFSVNFINSNTFTFRTAEKEEPFTCKDYKSQLFNCEEPPEDDGTFLGVMCNNFWSKMDFFQKTACNFYKRVQGRKIIRDDLISSNYDTFMNEILVHFGHYNTQVEQFWFRVVIEFLALLGSLKSLANDFLERKLCEYKTSTFRVLDELKENFSSCVTSLTCDNCKEREVLDKKLLPLHGYPHNAVLLNELEEEVVRRISDQQIQMESTVKLLKKELRCFCVNYIQNRSGINQIEVFYFKLRDRIFVDDMDDKILDTILDYCEKGEFYIKKTLSDPLMANRNEDVSLASGEVPTEYKLTFDPVNENMHSTETYVQQLKEIINRERNLDAPPSECPFCPNESPESVDSNDFCAKFCEPKLNVLMKLLNFEENVLEIEENLKYSIRLIKSSADSQKESQEKEIFKWLNRWKLNVKKVLKLYRVKYEEKPEPPKTIQVGE